MRSKISDVLGIDVPIFAFSHSRDVVAAVTNAGGFGVLGASSYTAEELDKALLWLDDHVSGRPYGVDIVCPDRPNETSRLPNVEDFAKMVPKSHVEFTNALMRSSGLDVEITDNDLRRPMRVDVDFGLELLEVSLQHPIRLIANALGVPPRHMLEESHERGVHVAALVGAREHARKQVEAGVDIVIAQGTEAGGHTGEVTTLVLVPEVIEAVRETSDAPVLAAGGIVTGRQMAAAMALGAAGVWTGSVWLTTKEAETAPATVDRLLAASSRQTVRSRSRTGKPSRQLRSAWTDAWDASAAPVPLPMPFQSLVSEPVLHRIDILAASGDPAARDFATYFVGQGVGLMNRSTSVREVIRDMMEDFVAAYEDLTAFLGQ